MQFSSTINHDALEVTDTSCLDTDALPTIDVEAFRHFCDETAKTPKQPLRNAASQCPDRGRARSQRRADLDMRHTEEGASPQADAGQGSRDPQVCLEAAPLLL